jgi:hypothetical protein
LDMGLTLRGECAQRNKEREGNLTLEYGWCVCCIGVNIVMLN